MQGRVGRAPEFTPRRSSLLGLFIAIAHGGSAAVVTLADLSPWSAAALMFLVLGSWARAHGQWHAGGWGANATYCIAEGAAWLVRDGQGRVSRYAALPPWFVHPWLIVVRLRRESGARRVLALVLLPDSLPADTARRLRVWLRWGG